MTRVSDCPLLTPGDVLLVGSADRMDMSAPELRATHLRARARRLAGSLGTHTGWLAERSALAELLGSPQAVHHRALEREAAAAAAAAREREAGRGSGLEPPLPRRVGGYLRLVAPPRLRGLAASCRVLLDDMPAAGWTALSGLGPGGVGGSASLCAWGALQDDRMRLAALAEACSGLAAALEAAGEGDVERAARDEPPPPPPPCAPGGRRARAAAAMAQDGLGADGAGGGDGEAQSGQSRELASAMSRTIILLRDAASVVDAKLATRLAAGAATVRQ